VGFSLAAEQKGVVRICRLVEGMPLGIELATAWLKTLSCDQIAYEIEHSLDTLATRLQNIPIRHRSMRVVFEGSWQLLPEAEQDILKHLSVIRGGFEPQAAESVTGASLMTLAVLVEKSLLRVTAGGRYQMHELLRQFAGEKLAQYRGEETAAHQRHSNYYLGFLKARQNMLTGREQPKALDEISLEIDNIRAGWRWAVAQGPLETIDQTVEALYHFYQMRSRYKEGEEIFAQAIAHLHQAEGLHQQPSFEAILNRLVARQGAFYYFLGDFEAANKSLLESLNSEEQPTELAFALTRLGEVACVQAKPAIAEERLRKSLAICREISDQYGAAKALQGLATTKLHFGDYAAAAELAREILALSRQLGRPDLVADALGAVAWPTNCLGGYRESAAYWQESLAIYQKIGNQQGVALSLHYLGWVAWCFGGTQLSKAIDYYQKASIIYREIGNRRGISLICSALARATGELGNHELALQYIREGLTVAREIGDIHCILANLFDLGSTMCGLGDLQTSRNYLTEALQLAWKTQKLEMLMNTLFYFAAMLVKESDLTAGPEPFDPQKKMKALELLSIVIGHPAAWQAIKDRAAYLQARLEAELPLDVITTAKTHGKSHTLAEVIEEILQLTP
jgi:tetratricopeptide (TPR) repeat protein